MKDGLTLKRLVLVKRLYLEGVEKAKSQHNYADQMLSILNLFLSVETLLRAVILDMDEQPDTVIGTIGYANGAPSLEQVQSFDLSNKGVTFEQIYNQVVVILRSEGELGKDERLFKWERVKRLQAARNDAQHGAIAPHPDYLPELTQTALDFIECVLKRHFSAFGHSIAEISLADLLGDDVLRQYVKAAENALAQGQHKVSVLLIRVAFLLGRLKRRYDWWRDRKGSKAIDDYDGPGDHIRIYNYQSRGIADSPMVNPDAKFNQKVLSQLWEIMTQARKTPRMFDNWTLGLDKVDRDRLEEVTPRITYYSEKEKRVGFPPSDEIIILTILDKLLSNQSDWRGPHFQTEPSMDDCLWACDYVTDFLLRWEREARGRFTAVDTKYLDVLLKLVEIVLQEKKEE